MRFRDLSNYGVASRIAKGEHPDVVAESLDVNVIVVFAYLAMLREDAANRRAGYDLKLAEMRNAYPRPT